MLTDTLIEALSPRDKRYQEPEDGGLFLRVSPSGKKVFFYEFRLNGHKISGSCGQWPQTSLKEARAKLAELKISDEAAKLRALSFKSAVDAWLAMKAPTVDQGTLKRARGRLERHVLPAMGKICLLDITAQRVINALMPIYTAGKSETLKRCIGLINQVLGWCVNGGMIPSNPCAQVGNFFLKKTKSQHRPTIPASELPQLLTVIHQAVRLSMQGKLFVYWSICSLLRPGENAAMRWDWIEGDVLTVPAEVTKMRREHRVPLTPFMLEILAQQRKVVTLTAPGSPYVWPITQRTVRTKREHISAESLTKFLRENGYRGLLVAHGFRAMGRTWMAEQGITHEICEACLAHVDQSSVVQAYQRSDFLERRRLAMELWTDYVKCYLDKAVVGLIYE